MKLFKLSKLGQAISLATLASYSVVGLTQQTAESDRSVPVEEVIVVGSHIKGVDTSGTLPVSQLNKDDLTAVGGISTDELITALPQAGGNAFTGENQGPNSARGDVAAANLRGLGSGNTLALLNGRRMVLHPTTQSENGVPVQIANINAIPGSALDRVEVLRDGAGATYGADATAGVLNHVIDTDFVGAQLSVRHGFSEGTDLDETALNAKWGTTFNNEQTNLAVFATIYDRNGLPGSDREYSASDDRRPLVSEEFAARTDFRNTSSNSPWGVFRLLGGVDTDALNAGLPNAVVNGNGDFHVTPCGTGDTAIDGGICIGSGGIPESLRYDEGPFRLITPDSERFNILTSLTHEFDSGTEYFGEFLYYESETFAGRGGSGPLSSARLTVSADNPFNPFGSGAGRLAGLDGLIPAEGVDLEIRNYRIFDAGLRTIEVEQDIFRILSGFRGQSGDWDWEFAGLYSEADSVDTERNRVSSTAIQALLNSADPTQAYNPFNGGDPSNTNIGDTTINAAQGDAIRIDAVRASSSSLALFDFKLSNSNLFQLRGNDVSAAFGIEWRREEILDDRDARIDGTINFDSARTGLTSDVVNTSPSTDTAGSRHVFSGYSELFFPLIAEEDNIPLVQNVEVQIAARYESFSDIEKEVVTPKIAASWQVQNWLSFRAAYSEGFRAPNLEQVNAQQIRRVQENIQDLGACVIQGVIANANDDANCNIDIDVQETRGGSSELDPEDIVTTSAGIVLLPTDNITITVDWWNIEQEKIVGITGFQDILDLDAFLIDSGGTGLVTRDTDGLATDISNTFLNLGTREVSGVDVSFIYDVLDTRWGDFRFKTDVAFLNKFDQEPTSLEAQLAAFRGESAGEAISLLKVGGGGKADNPYTRASASLSWRNGSWGASVFARYVGATIDTSADDIRVDSDGDGILDMNVNLPDSEAFEVEDFLQINVSGNYTFQGGALDQTTVTLGVNNIADEAPPVADEIAGFANNLHNNRERYFYLQVSKTWE